MMKYLSLIVIPILLLNSVPVIAHNVTVFAYIDNNEVVTESYFSDGKKCRNSRIEVYNKNGEKIVEGTTDKNGIFRFQPSIKSELKIVLNAGMGHRAEYKLEPEEINELNILGEEHYSEKVVDTKVNQISKKEEEVIMISKDDLEKIIEKVVDKKLVPVKYLIKKMEYSKKPGITEIIGGIGFIIGIFGIIYYFKSKKDNEK